MGEIDDVFKMKNLFLEIMIHIKFEKISNAYD